MVDNKSKHMLNTAHSENEKSSGAIEGMNFALKEPILSQNKNEGINKKEQSFLEKIKAFKFELSCMAADQQVVETSYKIPSKSNDV